MSSEPPVPLTKPRTKLEHISDLAARWRAVGVGKGEETRLLEQAEKQLQEGDASKALRTLTRLTDHVFKGMTETEEREN